VRSEVDAAGDDPSTGTRGVEKLEVMGISAEHIGLL
jgi:hypothetical protein